MIYYLNFDGVFSTIFDSQVSKLLQYLISNEQNIGYINFDKNLNDSNYKRKIQTLKDYGLKVYEIEKIKRGTILENLILNSYIRKLSKLISSFIETDIILHCRGHIGSYLGLQAKNRLKDKNIRVIADLRGAMIEEYELIYKDKSLMHNVIANLSKDKLISIEKYVIFNADKITCVSNSFKNYLVRKYNYSKDISVVPTCIDLKQFCYDNEARKRIRKELCIEDRYVVVFSGGCQNWQQPDKIMDTFIKIKSIRENSVLLILSNDIEGFNSYMIKYNIPKNDNIIMSVPYNKVNQYLSACDLALLLRENTIINKVASPTKFAEYLSCFLPVVVSPNIGDLDEYIKTYKFGIYETEISSNFETKINMNSEDYLQFLNKVYSWEIRINQILDMYREV